MSWSRVFFIPLLMLAALAKASSYDQDILSDAPRLYFSLGSTIRTDFEPDLSGHGHRGVRHPRGALPWARLPNGERASIFDGKSTYIEVGSAPDLSVPTTGVLTIEAWMRPDVLDFAHAEGDGYVHWLGKGMSGAHEYALRMYSATTSSDPPRPQRVSAYAFNLSGGLGSGSYFQDPIAAGQWLHVVAVINSVASSATYPRGYVRLYKNGVLRDTTGLDQFDVTPRAGNAPLRLGTRDLRSFFQGAIGKVAIYDRELPAARIRAHFQAMAAQRPWPRPRP